MVYSLDTNILLLDAHNIASIGNDGDIIVLAETVLDEIDSKKSGLGEIAYQAREFGRVMTRGKLISTEQKSGMTLVKYKIANREVHIVSLSTYPNYSSMERNVISDRKIIECTLYYKKVRQETEVRFMTNDIACGIRAQSLGLDTMQLKDVEDTEIVFDRHIEIPLVQFSAVHGMKATELDKEYTKSYYNYYITNPDTSQMKIAVVRNGLLQVIGKETEQELRSQEVNPRNAGQLLLSKAIQDSSNQLVIVEALAGSGKTLVALSNAIKLVKTNSPYGSILYIRGSVDDVEENEKVGFLKGDIDEKNEIYFHPMMDSLAHIAKARLGNKKLKGREMEEAVENVIHKITEDCDIQMMTGLGLRGRTFEDAVIIIDEAQNFSKSSLRKILTRFGKNCKVIVVGSNRQIDNSYVTKYTNGLSVLLDAAKKEQSVGIHAIRLTKVVRSEFAEFAENIFE